MAGSAESLTVILVTHHVEEIPPGFDMMLILAEGRVEARGEIRRTLTSDTLTGIYGIPIGVTSSNGRYMATGDDHPERNLGSDS